MKHSRSFRARAALAAGVLIAGLLAACASPTPLPGALETAVGGTVEAGGTAIAAAFVAQRTTLTAGAPTITLTPTPSDTPTATPSPTETPTATDTATPEATATATEPTATPTKTYPPPPTNTPVPPTPAPVTAGTYLQGGTCTTVPGYSHDYISGTSNILQSGRWTMCVTSIVVRETRELQVNVTWTSTELPNGKVTLNTWIPAHEATSQAVYLVDSSGQRYDQIQLEGAARDGGNGTPGTVVSGYYLYPAASAGVRQFTLFISDKDRTIPNLTLGVPTP